MRSARALLWMVESWRSAVEAGDPDWQHAARANLAAWRPHHARLKGVFSHESPVDAAAFSPDGKIVLTGGDDATARLWDAATGRPIGQPIRHEGVVTSVAFSPDGRTILTGSMDKTARLWDAATGQPVGSPSRMGEHVVRGLQSRRQDHSDREPRTRWRDSGTRSPIVRSVSPSCIRTCNIGGVQSRRQILLTGAPRDGATLGRRHRQAHRLAPATSGFLLARRSAPTASPSLPGCDGTVRRWNAATGKPVGEPIRHRLKVQAVAISPDGRTVLTGSEDKTARLWDAVTNQPIGPPLVHQGPVAAVAFSPDGKTFLTASTDKTVKLWDADPGQPFGLILDREYETWARPRPSAPMASRSSRIHRDGTPRTHWNATTGEPHRADPYMLRSVGVAVSPDGSTLLTGSADKTAAAVGTR